MLIEREWFEECLEKNSQDKKLSGKLIKLVVSNVWGIREESIINKNNWISEFDELKVEKMAILICKMMELELNNKMKNVKNKLKKSKERIKIIIKDV